LTQVEIRSEIPSFDPSKDGVEAAIRDVFNGLPGKWRVEILCSKLAERWMVRINGPALEWYLTLIGAERRPRSGRCGSGRFENARLRVTRLSAPAGRSER
jgi:hypothetical protein